MSGLATFRRVIMLLDDFQLLFSPIHQLCIHVFVFIEITVVTLLYIQRLEQKNTINRIFHFHRAAILKFTLPFPLILRLNVYLSTLLITLKILSLTILKYQRRIKDQIKRGLSQSYKLFRFLQILQICRIYCGNNSDKKNIKRTLKNRI